MSDERKVFLVDVEISFPMAVVASSKEEARTIAEENYKEDMEEVCDFGIYASPRLMAKCPEEFHGVIPWGPDNDDPRRDWTVDQWLSEEKADG